MSRNTPGGYTASRRTITATPDELLAERKAVHAEPPSPDRTAKLKRIASQMNSLRNRSEFGR